MKLRTALLFAYTIAVVSFVAIGGAKGDIYGAPNLDSIYAVGHGQAVVAVGYVGFGGVWNPASNGSQIYAGQLFLSVVPLVTGNSTFKYDTWVDGHGWVNATAPVDFPLGGLPPILSITVNLPADPSWKTVELVMDGTPWFGQVATPISLLPNSIANVGGLDILGLGIISETLISFGVATGLAALIMRRARYAPRFPLLIWGHVLLVSIAGAVLLDYQLIDQTFAGWSPLVYAFAVSPMWFAAVLSRFNDSKKAEILQGVVRPSRRFTYRRWLLRLATLPDGRVILCKEGWFAFWARVWGAYVVVDDGDATKPRFFEAAVQRVRSPTDTRAREGSGAKNKQGRTAPVDDFIVANPQDDGVSLLLFTDTSEPVVVHWPHIEWHRSVTVPAKVSKEGAVLVPEHTARRLSRPHYTVASLGALRLSDEHYLPAALVGANHASVGDLARVLSKVKTELYALKAAFEARVNDRVEALLVTQNTLVARTTTDLTDGEADAEAIRPSDTHSLADLYNWEHLPSGKATKEQDTEREP